jgi:hypothetical protein
MSAVEKANKMIVGERPWYRPPQLLLIERKAVSLRT